MRIFSYRNKRTLRRIALIALLAVVLLGLLILARISYLGRYVVYSPNGVYFDKTQKLQRDGSQITARVERVGPQPVAPPLVHPQIAGGRRQGGRIVLGDKIRVGERGHAGDHDQSGVSVSSFMSASQAAMSASAVWASAMSVE